MYTMQFSIEEYSLWDEENAVVHAEEISNIYVHGLKRMHAHIKSMREKACCLRILPILSTAIVQENFLCSLKYQDT